MPPTPPSPPAEVIVGVPGGVEGGVPGGVPGGVVAVVAGGVQGALVTPRSDGEKSEAEKLVDEEIARRIRYANERFSKPGAPGSQSDRGRIYLLWGPPDELEVHPGTKEAWLYHQLAAYGKNAIFEFDGAGKLTKAPTRPAAK